MTTGVQFSTTSYLWTEQESALFKRFEKCKPHAPVSPLNGVDLDTWVKDALGKKVEIDDLTWEELSQAAYGDPKYHKLLQKMAENLHGEPLPLPADARNFLEKVFSLSYLPGLRDWLGVEAGKPRLRLRYPLGDLCQDGSRLVPQSKQGETVPTEEITSPPASKNWGKRTSAKKGAKAKVIHPTKEELQRADEELGGDQRPKTED